MRRTELFHSSWMTMFGDLLRIPCSTLYIKQYICNCFDKLIDLHPWTILKECSGPCEMNFCVGLFKILAY